MIVVETTHHGNFRRVTERVLPDPPTRGDVAAMLASCVYPYTHVEDTLLDNIHADLLAGREAQHGWTRWDPQ
jgi:hypothetical protein